MKKRIFTLIFISILLLPMILAVNFKIDKKSTDETIIIGIDKPAVFVLEVVNVGRTGTYTFDSVPGFFVMDSYEIKIPELDTKEVILNVYAREDFSYTKPYYTLEYTITGGNSTPQKEELSVKVVDLKNAFEIGSEDITPQAVGTNIYIKNRENFNFEKINAKFSSQFFDEEKEFVLRPREKKVFTVMLDGEKFKQLTAGFYTMNAEIETAGQKATIDGDINFIEQDLTTSTKKEYGVFITTNVISKINDGNVLINSNTTIKKNIISRLFTTFSPSPEVIKRDGFVVYYGWFENIKPGDQLNIVVKTNWLFPFLIVFFIVAAVIFAKQYSKTNVILKKKVCFVKTKGGEFALKVSIFASARKFTDRITIVDRLPPLVKLHEKFMGQAPSRIDEKNKRLEWDIGRLETGEVRVLSYIIYSKVGVMGKFSLPSATAIYESHGKVEETSSNRAFFIAEQRTRDIEY